MANTIQKVALCSPTGTLGPFLHTALVEAGFEVTLVVRKSSKASFSETQSVIRISDDFPENELKKAFSGQHAVVLSLPFEMLSQGKKFAEASIAAGCKWLIPSTYGGNLEDPKHALFPANIPHRQNVDDLIELGKGQSKWKWTSISCGPWPEVAISANAWALDRANKTAEIVESGNHIFTTTTRRQLGRAVAGILQKQPDSAKNKTVYISSFEVDMLTWLDAHKKAMESDEWTISNIGADELLKRSQDQLAQGDFSQGYMGSALVVCTAPGYANQFSKVATLLNEELGLPKEDIIEVVKEGFLTPNPFLRDAK